MTQRVTIRKMNKNDSGEVFAMMKPFYASPAVICKASDNILKKDIEACIGDNPLVEGFVFELDCSIVGYAVITWSFSTEAGGATLWIEDLYIKPEHRGCGIGTEFFEYIEAANKNKYVRLRLEVEKENKKALNLYRKYGFKELPYSQMIKDNCNP